MEQLIGTAIQSPTVIKEISASALSGPFLGINPAAVKIPYKSGYVKKIGKR